MWKLSRKQVVEFRAVVWAYYRAHGRHELPWRQARHLKPYDILVSEVMLQQTQAARVVPKYRTFLRRFPSARALARASLFDVLQVWQGLGYNRRAKALHECARAVGVEHGGRFPTTREGLLTLPGVGPYTAGAIVAFAYDEPTVLIETNVRTVYLHRFLRDSTDVSDRQLVPLVEQTLERNRPREWYWALMDYGAFLKRQHGNPNRRSRHYVKQAPFAGSDRQLRGAIIRMLANGSAFVSQRQLAAALPAFSQKRVEAQLQKLAAEGLLVQSKDRYALAS